MKNIQKKGQHSPVVQLFLKHLVSSNALFFIFPPQTLARVQRSAILRSQSRPREALLARTNYAKKNFAAQSSPVPKVSGSMHFAYCACARKRSGRHATRVSYVTSGNPINFDPVPGVRRLSETNADSGDSHDPHDVDLILSARPF